MRSGVVLLVALAICADCFGGAMLMRHKPLWSRGPVKIGLFSCRMVTLLLVKMALLPLSQSCTMEIRAWSARAGKMCAVWAAAGRPGRYNAAVCVERMVLPSGRYTLMGLCVGTLLVHGLLTRM
jgi:hypothetical protein